MDIYSCSNRISYVIYTYLIRVNTYEIRMKHV